MYSVYYKMDIPNEILFMIYEYIPLHILPKYLSIDQKQCDTIRSYFDYIKVPLSIDGIIQKYLDMKDDSKINYLLKNSKNKKEIIRIIIKNYKHNDYGIHSKEYLPFHAIYGHIDYIKLKLHERIFENRRVLCYEICFKAAENNHFDIVQWIVEKIYRYNSTPSIKKIDFFGKREYETIFNYILKHQNMKMIVWSLYNGYDWSHVSNQIIKNGLTDNHKILFHVVRTCNFTLDPVEITIYLDNLEFLIWLRDNYFSLDSATNYAAKYGRFLILKWLIKNHYQIDSVTCCYAIRGNHLEILRWLIMNGCKYDVYMCTETAKTGNLEILEWLRKNNCPWDKQVCSLAVKNYHFKLLDWAIKHGAEFDPDDYYKAITMGYESNQSEHFKYFFKYYYIKAKKLLVNNENNTNSLLCL